MLIAAQLIGIGHFPYLQLCVQCAATLSRRERKKQRKKARDKFQLGPVESRINLNLSADAGYQFVFYLLTVRINYASSPAAYVAVAASSSSNNSTSNNNDYSNGNNNNRAGDLLSPCNVVAGRWLNSSADTVATSSSSSSSSLSSELLLRLELATVRNQASAVQFHQTTFTHSFTFTAMTTVTNFFDSFSTLVPHCSLSRAPALLLTFVAQVFCYDFVALAHSSSSTGGATTMGATATLLDALPFHPIVHCGIIDIFLAKC